MATHSSILAWRIPLDRGAWWATVHRVAKSHTRLKQLSNDSSGPGSPGTTRLFPGWLAPQRPARHLRFLFTCTTFPTPQPPGRGRMCTVSCGAGALAFTRMRRQPVQECRTMEKCLSAWPGPRAAWPLIIESASMSSSWGRNGQEGGSQ